MNFLRNTLLAAFIAALVPASQALAAAAVVTNLSGTLTVEKANGAVRILSQNSEVDAGDTLSTEKGAYARIKFSDGGEVTLRPGSRLKIDSYSFNENEPEKDSFVFSMLKGGLRTITGLVGKRGNRDAYRLNTATATIGIRGTNYGALMCQGDCGSLANGLYLDVVEGIINAANPTGQLDYSAGQFGFVESLGKAPVLLPQDPGIPKFEEPGSAPDDGGEAPPLSGPTGCKIID